MKILFKITTRSRQALFIRTINSILENIENKDNYHLLISIDDDDPAMNPPPVLKSEHYTYVSGKSKNKIDAINRDVNDFDYDWDILVNVSDDQVFILNGFDNIIRDAFSDNTDQYIHFSDGYQKVMYPQCIFVEENTIIEIIIFIAQNTYLYGRTLRMI